MRLKSILTTAFLLGGLLWMNAAQAQEQIKWISWEQAVGQWQADMKAYNEEPDEAKKVPPKKFFVDVYTSWCGWCKRMDASTFQDPTVVKFMNDNYYPVKMDAEMTHDIEFNGHTFVNPAPDAKRSTHQLAASLLDNHLSYPSYVILDENTHRITIYKGFKQPVDMLSILSFFATNQYLVYKQYLEKQPKPAEANN